MMCLEEVNIEFININMVSQKTKEKIIGNIKNFKENEKWLEFFESEIRVDFKTQEEIDEHTKTVVQELVDFIEKGRVKPENDIGFILFLDEIVEDTLKELSSEEKLEVKIVFTNVIDGEKTFDSDFITITKDDFKTN